VLSDQNGGDSEVSNRGPWARAGQEGFLEEEVLPEPGPRLAIIMKNKGC